MLFSKQLAFAQQLATLPAYKAGMYAIAAMFVLTLVGCGDNPGKWPKEKVAEHVKQSLIEQEMEMNEVTLTDKPGGGFEGTGKVAGGETLKLTVTQDADDHRLIWEAQGDRGSILDGSYRLK
ncbi:MAG: hypothetical protein ABI557_12200 [Aureliella sp.]